MPTNTIVDPPPIAGVRRSFVTARGIRFHVTEAGDGRPVVALHGWPQHHYAYRDLLSHPPAGLRIIAPDLPGYGWSGPPPHRWAKEDVARDVLALLDALGLERVLLVGHDWGGYVGYLMVLADPKRFDGFLPLNIAHPWQSPVTAARHLWRFALYQPLMAAFGVPVQRRTRFIERFIFGLSVTNRDALSPAVIRMFADRFRDPVCARTGTDTYRTFLMRELPASARHRETRRATVPIRALFGVRDKAIHRSLAAPDTANADDYTLKETDCGHFIADEKPDLVRARLVDLANETASANG